MKKTIEYATAYLQRGNQINYKLVNEMHRIILDSVKGKSTEDTWQDKNNPELDRTKGMYNRQCNIHPSRSGGGLWITYQFVRIYE